MSAFDGGAIRGAARGPAMRSLLDAASSAAGEGRMADMLDALTLAAAVAEAGAVGDDARRILERALGFADRVGDEPHRIALALTLAGLADDDDAFEPLMLRATALERFDLVALAWLTRSWRGWCRGDLAAAHDDAAVACRIAVVARVPSVWVVAAFQLADLCEARGDAVGAVGLVEGVRAQAAHVGGEAIRALAAEALHGMWARWGSPRFDAARAAAKARSAW